MSNGGLAPGSPTIVDVVVDASVAVKWFVPENHTAEALCLLDARFRRHIPVLLQTEVGQTIWKKIAGASFPRRAQIDPRDFGTDWSHCLMIDLDPATSRSRPRS